MCEQNVPALSAISGYMHIALNQRRSSIAMLEPCILTNAVLAARQSSLETIKSSFSFEDSGVASHYGQGKPKGVWKRWHGHPL